MRPPAGLYACLYASEFPAQALSRLRPGLRDKPFAVMQGQPPLQRVCSCNTKGRLMGVAYGMTGVEMDHLPSVVVLPRSLAEEAAAKTVLLECAGTFSPSVEDRSSDKVFQCVIDISGTDRLHGSPEKFASTLNACTQALGITSTVAVASNFYAAVCLARGIAGRKRLSVIPSGAEAAALAGLPLAVLDLTEQQAETFSLWGIHTLGMLAALPEVDLIARMGQAGKRLSQLARGALPHLFVPLEAGFVLEEYLDLDAPVDVLESVLFLVGVMLEQLVVRAAARVLALASLTIQLGLEGGQTYTRVVRPALPTNDRPLWIKLLHLDLEAHPPGASILSLRLTAEPGSTSKVQLGLFSPQFPDPERLDVTLARIRAIVGEENVGCAVLMDSHRADHFQMKPFTVVSGSGRGSISSGSVHAMRVLRPAEHAFVTLREDRPASLHFRGFCYVVERAYGPWLAGGEWWNRTGGLQQWDILAAQGDVVLCCCLVLDPSKNKWQVAALYD